MREIKFRGKCIGDIDDWITGYYHFDKQTGKHWIADIETLIAKEVNPETVGQNIGAQDKNNKDIYENDKVITDEAGWIGKVTFGEGMFYCKDNLGGFSSLCNWRNFEIIENK